MNFFTIKSYHAFVVVLFISVSAAYLNDRVVDLEKVLSEVKILQTKVVEMEIEKEERIKTMDDLKIKFAKYDKEKEEEKQMSGTQIPVIKALQRKVNAIENEMATRNGICRIKNNPCGYSCICVEDYRLVNNKFFCDCRSQKTRRDCKEHHKYGARINGLYTINTNIQHRVIQVFCDHTTDGGGWTILQRRMDGSENFNRNWNDYKMGFGQLHREHWIGNENIFRLTSQAFFRGSEVIFQLIQL